MRWDTLKTWALRTIGVCSLACGLLALVVPLVPTTPFVLIAASCFAASSPEWHAWLLQHPTMGPLIVGWQDHRSIPRWARPRALGMIAAVFTVSVWMIDLVAVKILVGAIGLGVFIYVSRVPVLDDP